MSRRKNIDALLSKSEKDLSTLKTDYDAALRVKNISEEIKIDIKNIFENLRSAHDYLAHDISDQMATSQPTKLYFPIRQSSAEFEKNSDAISKLVTRLGDQTVAIKTLTTLDNLNNTMDSAVLTQEELRETLEKQVGDGKSFEEMFKENPDLFSQGGVGGGLISRLLGGLGLGGLAVLIAPTVGRRLGRHRECVGGALRCTPPRSGPPRSPGPLCPRAPEARRPSLIAKRQALE